MRGSLVHNIESITEALATLPGVTVSQSSGPGALASVSIRGSSPEQVAVFIDGARIGSATTRAPAWAIQGIDLSYSGALGKSTPVNLAIGILNPQDATDQTWLNRRPRQYALFAVVYDREPACFV